MGSTVPNDFADVFARNLGEVGERLEETLPRMLRSIRRHLQMDVAFIAEFVHGQRVFRRVDVERGVNPTIPLPQVGKGHALETTYCQRIADGRCPELIPDAAEEPALAGLEKTTAELHIGAYIGVPLRLSDGHVYGTMCCYNFVPDHSLSKRDLGIMRVLAEAVSDVIEHDIQSRRRQRRLRNDVAAALQGEGMTMVYQPIVDLNTTAPVGFEALSRFSVRSEMDTEGWFENAARIGRDVELELHAVQRALAQFTALPDDSYLAVNVSADCLISGGLNRILGNGGLDRLVLEITERSPIRHYDELSEALDDFRRRGARLAVDDAGAGYASFRHILVLQPDLIKLDKSLVRDIDKDPSRRELASALIQFADKTGSQLIAEGVETEQELTALRRMGVHLAQGYFLGSPRPMAA